MMGSQLSVHNSMLLAGLLLQPRLGNAPEREKIGPVNNKFKFAWQKQKKWMDLSL
jgi:hypothetical protein